MKLKNWRNITKVDLAIAERLFITGPNASGKSNLLDAFRFLRDIAKTGGGLQAAIALRGGLAKLRCLAARQDPNVEIEVELKDPAGTNPQSGATESACGRNREECGAFCSTTKGCGKTMY